MLIRTTLVPLFTVGALLCASPDVQAQKSDAEVRSSIDFARGLAADWGFVGLSEEVIRSVEREGVSEKLGQELGLLKCEIYYIAAKGAKAEERDPLLKKSVAAYEDFVARNSFSEFKDEAEAQLVSVAGYYARSLAFQLQDALGEEATALRNELQTVLNTSIAKTSELVDGLKTIPSDDRSEAEKRRLFELLKTRGDMLLELAKTQEDGTFSFAQSIKSYENLVDEAGEASPPGLQAFVGIGDNLRAQGEAEEASGYYEFVVELAIPTDPVQWAEASKDMTQEEKEKRFLFVQLATEGLVQSLSESGETAKAARWGLHFYGLWKREGLSLTTPIGQLSLLAVARTLLDAGGWIGGNTAAGDVKWFEDEEAAKAEFPASRNREASVGLALSIAEQVNSQNKGTTLQLRAQRVISEIISRPGIQVDPETLFEAAQGEFLAKDYPAAITALKRVLAALEGADQARRTEIGPKVLWHIGRSFQFMERDLEAAMAFEAALTDWQGDPQYDALNAQRLYQVAKNLRTQAKGDALVEELWSKSETWAARYNASAEGDILYAKAQRAYDDDRFEEAVELYKQVPKSAQNYEKALVWIGVTNYKLGRLDAANAAFKNYLETFLGDALNTTTDPGKLAKRSEAVASATFYWGLSAYKQAEDGQGEWSEVVRLYTDFEKKFPEQTSYAPAALYRLMIALIKVDQNEKAKKVFATMLELFPDNRWTGTAAKSSYDLLKERFDKETDPAKKMAILREMAENLQIVNKTATSPSFNNLRAESLLWIQLREWAVAEELLTRLVTQFSQSDAESIDKYVRPDMALVYQRQYKVEDAVNAVKALVDENLVNRETARIYALAQAGWLEVVLPERPGEQAVVKQVPGLAAKVGEASFDIGAGKLTQLADSSEKWEAEWYGFKADQIYAYYAWGQVDGKKLETAKSLLSFISTQMNSQFEADSMPEVERQKLLWLRGKLR